MNRSERFECSGVHALRLKRRVRANDDDDVDEEMVYVDFCVSKHLSIIMFGEERYSRRRFMDETSSFHISLQRLMAQSPADLETQLVDTMNDSISNGDRFNGYAGFISDCIHRVVSTLGPEHHGLKVWVKLDRFIVQSRYREETIFSVVGEEEEEEELESVRYGGNGGIADEEEVCPVCLQSLVFGEEIKRTPCGHLYHSECIFSWLKRSHTCPVCRFQF